MNKIIYPDFSMPKEYYESFYFKCQAKVDELRKDCLNYKFCPICTNTLEEHFKKNKHYFYCTKDKFYIDKQEFSFKINKIIYLFSSYASNITTMGFIKVNFCEYSDLINTNELNALSIIKLYNNLNKLLIFK